jgi:hypothetical protein
MMTIELTLFSQYHGGVLPTELRPQPVVYNVTSECYRQHL